jgi:KDO2-lipid IV(A) lauroyltransferase
MTTTSLRHRCQLAALGWVVAAMRRMGPVAASNLGGFVARHVGPWLPASRTALGNLAFAMPELTEPERRLMVRNVWDNLGRTVAELPHLGGLQRTVAGPGWECDDDSTLRDLVARAGPAILFSGHIANWEIGFPVAAALGLDVSWFYRRASSAVADQVIQGMRDEAAGHHVPMFAKGAEGAKAALKHLRGGGLLGMLVDQKLNEGIPVPFFGRMAMTTPSLAQFALHFECPVIPIRSVRLGPARFRVICDPPMYSPKTGDRAADVYAMMVTVNATLERWIREQPGCWLWLHRRWPKPA